MLNRAWRWSQKLLLKTVIPGQKSILQRLVVDAGLNDLISVTPITGGEINLAYKVETQSHTFMLKLLVDNGFTSIDRRRQFLLQQHLHKLGIAPEPVWLSDDQDLHLEQWVDAPTLDKLAIQPTDKIDLAIELMANLHSAKVGDIRSCVTLDLIGDWQRYLDYAELTPDPQLQEKIAQCSKIVSQTNQRVLCHNDIAFAHVIYDKETACQLMVDWEYAALGDRYFDLAGFIAINKLSSDNIKYALSKYAQTTALSFAQVEEGYLRQRPVVALTVQLWTLAAHNQPLAFY